MKARSDTDRTERALGRVLGVGTWVSTLLLAAGLLLETFAPQVSVLLHAGLVVLMATPALRVAVAIVSFGARREWWFVLCSTIVLVLLITGILVA